MKVSWSQRAAYIVRARPGTECFDGDAKGRRALCLGQAEPCPDLPQDRVGLAKFYYLTPKGRKQLNVKIGKWDKLAAAIARILRAAVERGTP